MRKKTLVDRFGQTFVVGQAISYPQNTPDGLHMIDAVIVGMNDDHLSVQPMVRDGRNVVSTRIATLHKLDNVTALSEIQTVALLMILHENILDTPYPSYPIAGDS